MRYVSRLSVLFPAVLLLAGAGLRSGVQPTTSVPLRVPLEALPERLGPMELASRDSVSEAEARVLRADETVLRTYRTDAGREVWLFAAYYGKQLSGSTIHSPRNCLPGSGWQPVRHERRVFDTPYGPGAVNRYVIEHETGSRALVYYWYQGRGRVAANEYRVKWDLLRDALVHRRTDEALVRLVVPLRRGESPDGFEGADLVEPVIRAVASHVPS